MHPTRLLTLVTALALTACNSGHSAGSNPDASEQENGSDDAGADGSRSEVERADRGDATLGADDGGLHDGGPSGYSADQHAACVAYVNAQCNRRLRTCAGGTPLADPCPELAAECPAWMFADGTGYTPDSALACAADWETYACDDLARGGHPACVAAGQKAGGESCVVNAQCASGDCKDRVGQLPSCGKACVDVHDTRCGNALACASTEDCVAGACRLRPAVPFVLLAPGGEGEPCQNGFLCVRGLGCFPGSSQVDPVSTCQAYPLRGAACIGNLCDSTNGDYCDEDGTCKALPASNQTCGDARGGGFVCASGLYCDNDDLRQRCVTSVPLGGQCLGDESCARGLSCFNDSPSASHCNGSRLTGESCTDTYGLCPLTDVCVGGVCTPDPALVSQYCR